jgi:hypothetical protein
LRRDYGGLGLPLNRRQDLFAQVGASAFAKPTADRAGQEMALDVFSRRWVHLVFDSLLRTAMA